MRAGTVTRSAVTAALAVIAIGLGCIAEVPPEPEAAEPHQILVVRTLQPYIAEYLEIDQLEPGAPADANLFTGPDPANAHPHAHLVGDAPLPRPAKLPPRRGRIDAPYQRRL